MQETTKRTGRIAIDFSEAGINATLKSKTVQQILQEWIEAATGLLFFSSFIDSLRDGVRLCRLINRIEPSRIHNVVEIPTSEEALENVNKFIIGCRSLGLCDWQLLDPKELLKADINNNKSTFKDDIHITQKVISTLYWLGSTLKTMSYYNGPRLDMSKLHRNSDGIIAVKKGTPALQHNSSHLSAMYGGVEDDVDSNPQVNGNVLNGINGYEENDIDSIGQKYEFSINVRIIGDEKRFGFSVMGGIDEGFPPRIDNIVRGSPAERADIIVGDHLLEVNGDSLSNCTHMEVISTIHKCLKNRVIALKLLRGQTTSHGGFSTFIEDPSADKQLTVDPATQQKLHSIMRDQENDPQFQYYNSDAETNSVHSYGHDQLDSPSNMRMSSPNWSKEDLILNQSNGGLQNADLLESNLRKNKSMSTALLDLRMLGSSDDQEMLSQENNAYDSDSNSSSNTPVPYEPQPVSPVSVQSLLLSSTNQENKSSGFDQVKPKLTTRNEQERMVYVEEYLAVKDVQNATKIYNKIMELKQERKGPGFTRPVSTNSHNIIAQVSTSLSNSSRTRDEQELEQLLYSPNIQGMLLVHDRLAFRESLPDEYDDEDDEEGELDRQHSLDDQISQVEDDTVKIVRIDKSNDPLGATVKNEDGSVVIGRIVKGGAAEKSGLLHEGDEILEINGVNMRGNSVAQVCELLEDMNGTLTFLVIPNSRSSGTLTRQNTVHVKAHYDYDPENDELIPCRELGLAFRKGAVLHIVNQEDPNWWQAWRVGEEGMKLAGLIPSKFFQQQRESIKHTLPKENETTTKEKRKCLCVKRKRRKKVLYNAMHSDGLEVDQALTYEEVALLDPNTTRKRPVVLIGPTKIGRKELRQRLTQYDPSRYVVAIPHTSRPRAAGEVNGRDYHFVSRRAFESEIATNRFVQHGELGDHYYGTRLDSIRAVINFGKICVLNLNCEALKTLRVPDVRPYVIFISPPSFERIKALRMGKVDPFNTRIEKLLTDDELHAMIDEGREMEDAYGHFFDYTITNTNLERTFNELLQVIDRIESDAGWVPASWVK